MTMELSAIARIAAALVSALLIAFITTPVVKSLAQIVGAVDVPKDGRRMHDHPIPRMGGLAIFLGFLLSTLLFVPMSSSLRGMLLGGVIIVILGIFDDIYALPAKPKLVVQIVAALVAVLHGNVHEFQDAPHDPPPDEIDGQRDEDLYQYPDRFRQQRLQQGVIIDVGDLLDRFRKISLLHAVRHDQRRRVFSR